MAPILSQLRLLRKKKSSLIAFHLSALPHWLLHQGSPQNYVTCPHYFLRTSAEITVGLWCILPSAGNIRTESSPFSSFSAFHTGGGHVSHRHSKPGMNGSVSAESHHSPVSCPWFTCWELPTIPQARSEVKDPGEYSIPPSQRYQVFQRKQKILVTALMTSVVSKNLKFFQKNLPENKSWKISIHFS